jgi:hypothetical protein
MNGQGEGCGEACVLQLITISSLLSVRASHGYHSSPDKGEESCVVCYLRSSITLIWHENSKQNHAYVLNVRSNNM